MSDQIEKWVQFFHGLIFTRFTQSKKEAIQTLIWVILGHLYGLYNPNQLADALSIPKSSLYSDLGQFSLPQWKQLLFSVGCQQALEVIIQTQAMSAATKSRRRITISVDDTVIGRDGKSLAYCYHWFSGRFHKTIKGQNVLAVILKIGTDVFPLSVRLIGKQGRANTTKPDVLKCMLTEIKAFFAEHGIDITDYPITFDSWYGSQPLREQLEQLGWKVILVHAKSNYVFTISGRKAKLGKHKRSIELKDDQWGCNKPTFRVKAESPTFGSLILLFFKDCGKLRCMMIFGRPLRAAEILSIWRQHHGIEQFWRNLKSIVSLSAMSLHGRSGAYANLSVKVLAYLLFLSVSTAVGLTFHQIQLTLSGKREQLVTIISHFHLDKAMFD